MTRRISLFVLAAVVASAVAIGAKQGRGPLELATAPVAAGALRIPYGSNPLQFGELRVPPTKGPHPVAIIVHGGCWVSQLGKLDPRAVAIDNMRPMAAALTESGIATWNVEYRRVGHPGGGWPGTFQDVGLAADALRGFAGLHALDLTRVVAVGHSAGGHFALWLAARSKVPPASEVYVKDPLPLIAAVNLDGPADLRVMIDAQLAICGRPVITELMGGSPEERPERYRAGSPAELLPTGVRQESFTGRAFGAQAGSYEAAAKRVGDSVTVTTIADAGHFTFIDPQSQVWSQVASAMVRLLLGR